jgi:mRNA interferase RelE/StbE
LAAKKSIKITARAARDIKSLDPSTRETLRQKLLEYADDPLRDARRLVSSRIGTYRFRIGRYRIIFDLEGDELIVLRVGHRKDSTADREEQSFRRSLSYKNRPAILPRQPPSRPLDSAQQFR